MILDLIDRKILAILDVNSRISITQLSKKIRLNRDTTNYRLQRLIKNKIIKKFITQIDITKFGYEIYKLYFKFQNLSFKERENLFLWLKNEEYVYWIAEARGKWDCNLTIFAKNKYHFDEIYSEFIDKFGKYIAEQELNITLEVGILQKNWKIKNQNRDLRKIYYSNEKLKLDNIDKKILFIISDNARIKTIEIAEKINISERIIRYRLKKLENKKIIAGYSISLDYKKIQKEFFKATIELNSCSRKLKSKIRAYCKTHQNIIYYIFCIGTWPLELEFLVDNNEEYYNEIEKLRLAFPEIKGYDTIIFSKEYKFKWLPKIF